MDLPHFGQTATRPARSGNMCRQLEQRTSILLTQAIHPWGVHGDCDGANDRPPGPPTPRDTNDCTNSLTSQGGLSSTSIRGPVAARAGGRRQPRRYGAAFSRRLAFISQPRVANGVAAYCPVCKGLMRPQKGAMVCIRCSAKSAGKGQARLAEGAGLGIRGAGNQGTGSRIDPPIAPQASAWKPTGQGTPHPLLGLFPHDEVRDTQLRLMRDVSMAVQQGRHLIAQAPTGLGKTAATLAPALDFAMKTGKKVLFLTSRQSQHRIAVDTVRLMRDRRGTDIAVVDLVAKRDMCLRPEAKEMFPSRFPEFCARETRNKSCSFIGEVDDDTLRAVHQGVLHVEELMHVSKQAHLCPHLVAMAAAQEGNLVVADYNHLFSDIRDQSLARLGMKMGELIVIVDEAHNLADRIRNEHSHRITPFLLDKVEGEAKEGKDAALVQGDIACLRDVFVALAEGAVRDGKDEAAKLGSDDRRVVRLGIHELHAAFEATRSSGLFSTRRTLSDVSQDLGKLASKIRKGTDAVVHAEELQSALEDWGKFANGALRFLEWDGAGNHALNIRLLDPGIPAKSVLEAVHSAILVSGTLRPPEMTRDLLGLREDRTAVRTYPSPFPPENRAIVVAQGMSTRYTSRGPQLWGKIGGIIVDVSATTKGNIAVFTPSYAMLREVRAEMDAQGITKPLVIEDPEWTKADRDRVLDDLRGWKPRGGAILLGVLGGSLAEGIDFKDNLLSAVLIVGLPLAPPDLEVEAAIAYLDTRFPGKGRAYAYTYPAMNKVLQAMGRPIRSATDKAAILLLDERFLTAPYRDLLPDGIMASFQPAAAVKPFLLGHSL